MRPEREAPRRAPRTLPELEAEHEVDFGRYWWAIVARWWLVSAAVAAGIVAGYLAALGGGQIYRAEATAYLGQPLSPGGGSQIQSPATNPSTVGQIVKSQSVVRQVAAQVGVPAGKLRSGVSTQAVAGAVARQGQTPLVEISVRGPWRQKSAQAANLLAATVIERVSGYVDTKIRSLEEQLAGQERELASIEARIETLQKAIEHDASLSSAERLTLVALVGVSEQRRGQLLEDRTQTEQLLTLARDVERGRIVARASAVEVDARSRRNSILVGALIGLLAGAVLALLWEPLIEQRRRRVS